MNTIRERESAGGNGECRQRCKREREGREREKGSEEKEEEVVGGAGMNSAEKHVETRFGGRRRKKGVGADEVSKRAKRTLAQQKT